MNILHLSDTHCLHRTIHTKVFEGVDLVIHSGDCSNENRPITNSKEVLDFIDWYKDIPVKHKIYVAGNHDTSIERRIVKPSHFEDAGIVYLENSSIIINGIHFWGSPHTPRFGEWAFMKSRDKINRVWETIPENTDVLIVHGPPKGIRDLSFDREGVLEMCGCSALFKRCMALKDSLKYVCFGHIHDMDGVYNQGVSHHSMTPTVFSNAACVRDGRFDLGLTSYGNKFILE